jgi:hypothetical protein
MSYSKGRRHMRDKGNKKSHVTLKICWKLKALLSTRAKASKKK